MNEKFKQLAIWNDVKEIGGKTYRDVWKKFIYDENEFFQPGELLLCGICNGSEGGIIYHCVGYDYNDYICMCLKCFKELEKDPDLNEEIEWW